VIRVTKAPVAPRSLGRGTAETTADCCRFDAAPADYRTGRKRFSFKKGIYGTEAVKRQLKLDQHGKCCFCEAIFDANVAGDVEHYRPKGAVDTPGGAVLPGYYWLAYLWSNLLYACPDCNSYRKRARFPLADERRRARDHHAPLAAEAPLLLDPTGPDDPRRHILFRGEMAIGCTPEGQATIDVLCLKRTALNLARRRHLTHLSGLRESIALLADDSRPEAIAYVAKSEAELAAAADAASLFSAAASDHLTALDQGISYLP